MGLDSSMINMKGVDSSLHLRYRYFFSKEKKVNKFIMFLHNFNQISFVTKTLIHIIPTCENLLSYLFRLHHLLSSPLSSFRQHIKSLERLRHMIKLAIWFIEQLSTSASFLWNQTLFHRISIMLGGPWAADFHCCWGYF